MRAPTTEIDSLSGFRENRFSYWVGDEGVKARVDLSDSAQLPTSELRYQATDSVVRLFSPPRSGTEQMLLDGAPVGDDFPSDPALLSRVGDTNSLALLFGEGERFGRTRFHDLTVYSTGLFTDQRLAAIRQS